MKEDEEDDEEPGANDEPDEEELKGIIEGFWETYTEFQKDFPEAIRSMKEDIPVYKDLQGLQKRFASEEPPSDDEVLAALKTMNLTGTIGMEFKEDPKSVFMRSPQDFVETLVAIPHLPKK